MYCSGSHHGYRVGIKLKNAKCLEDLQMIIPGHTNYFSSNLKKSEFSFLVMGKWISKPLLSVGK
jgi:hypothetical protein